MKPIELTQQFRADPATVFAAATDFANYGKRVQGIVKVERLTPHASGLGVRFRETRVMFGKEAAEVMEVVSWDPPRGYALECNSCGVLYRTEMTFAAKAGGTEMTMRTSAKALTFFAKLMSPLGALMAGSMRKMLAKDLEQLAAAVDREHAGK